MTPEFWQTLADYAAARQWVNTRRLFKLSQTWPPARLEPQLVILAQQYYNECERKREIAITAAMHLPEWQDEMEADELEELKARRNER